ncbi:MAG: antitoxin [Lachnospiraceae bacterium]|nr:antitoxin [Lachnospiraceae bacterium]
MSKSMLKIYTRVFKRRMDAGESFEDIIQDYPKLTEKEVAELKEALATSQK